MSTTRNAVVIGGALGGLEDLCHLAGALPRDFPAPIIAVLHTATHSPRMLAYFVRRHTHLPVEYGRDGAAVQPGHLYIAPPDFHLVVRSPGVLMLDDGPALRYSRPAADKLFESAAEVYGPRTVGVVLTGGGNDGTHGLRAVRSAGGVCVVQHATHRAQAASGPADHSDYAVVLDELAPLLMSLVARDPVSHAA